MINIWWGTAPIVLLFVLLLLFRRSLLLSGALFMVASAALALLVWLVYPAVMVGAFLKGIFVSIDIALIIGGSLLLLDVLKKTRVLSSLEHYLHRLTPDSRVQAILLTWFFGALLEGAAGFGTPAAVVAPLLVHLGFPVLTAASLALIANTVPVSFGAVGTPIRVGMNGIPVDGLVEVSVLFGFFLSFLIPILLAWVLRQDISLRRGIIGPPGHSHHRPSSILPFALWSGAAFAIPYWLAGKYNPDIPSLVGAFGGLLLTFLGATQQWWRKLFLPAITQRLDNYDPNQAPLTLFHTLLPYTLMILGLLIGRSFMPSYPITLPGGIVHTLNTYNPGIILLALAAFYAWYAHLTRAEIVHSVTHIEQRMLRTVATIIVLVAGVQLLVHSGSNASGLPGMLDSFSKLLFRENVGVISPLIGGVGGLVAGSTTISNLMFGQLQWNTAQTLGTSGLLVLCLQLYGATAGNALALTNISAVEGALGIKHQVRPLMQKLIGPIGFYLIGIILLGALLPVFLFRS